MYLFFLPLFLSLVTVLRVWMKIEMKLGFQARSQPIRQTFRRLFLRSTKLVQKSIKFSGSSIILLKLKGKISNRLNFPTNPVSSKAGNKSNKKASFSQKIRKNWLVGQNLIKLLMTESAEHFPSPTMRSSS